MLLWPMFNTECDCFTDCLPNFEVQNYDGWYNNLLNIDWGSAGNRYIKLSCGIHFKILPPSLSAYTTVDQHVGRLDEVWPRCPFALEILTSLMNFLFPPFVCPHLPEGSKLLRLAPASFADGVYQMWDEPAVPNARRLSSSVMRGESGLPSALNRTVLAVFFGRNALIPNTYVIMIMISSCNVPNSIHSILKYVSCFMSFMLMIPHVLPIAGQHIMDEIMDTRRAGCPAEFFNIPIPAEDPAFSNSPYKVLPFQRSQWDKTTGASTNNPRTPVNKVTSWLDGSAIYGPSRSWCQALRTFDRGMMRSSDEESLPPVSGHSLQLIDAPSPSYETGSSTNKTVYDVYVYIYVELLSHRSSQPCESVQFVVADFGNPRGNENPFLKALGTVWLRYHNFWAAKIHSEHSDWSDEDVFLNARKWVIGVYQVQCFIGRGLWLHQTMFICNTECPVYCALFLPSNLCVNGVAVILYMSFVKYVASSHIRLYPRHHRVGYMRFCILKCLTFILKVNMEFNVKLQLSARAIVRYRMRCCLSAFLCTTGYKPHVHPGIAVEFESAAMKFHQTMMPPGVYSRNATCSFNQVNASRLCNHFWTNMPFKSGRDVDEIIMGMSSQIAEREDHIIVEDLLDKMYGPLKATRSDLMALTIQQGRDHGAPTYNDMRRALHMTPIAEWEDFNHTNAQTKVIERLKQAYNGDISRLELWPGGLLECQGGPGPLFSRILVDQFERIRDGDRFWFENTNNGIFTEDEVRDVLATRFSHVLQTVMDIDNSSIQGEVFFWKDGETGQRDPCAQQEQLTVDMLEPCTPPKSMDYFSGSVATFIVTNLSLLLLPTLCFVVLWYLSRRRKKSFEKMTNQNTSSAGMRTEAEEHHASEWRGKKEPLRDVRLRFDDAGSIKVLDCAGALLRSLEVKALSGVELLLASDRGNLLLVHVPKEYDLVLFFDSVMQRRTFEENIERSMSNLHSFTVPKSVGSEKTLLKNAFTRSQRQIILEKYFRTFFAKRFFCPTRQVLEMDSNEPEPDELDTQAWVQQSLACDLSRDELGELLGLKPDSSFLQRMFHVADKDSSGYLSFSELRDILVILVKGTTEKKSQLMFHMFDINSHGDMKKETFRTMLSSFLEMSNYRLPKEEEESILNSLLMEHGLSNKTRFVWQDLHAILNEHFQDANNLQIHLKGVQYIHCSKLLLFLFSACNIPLLGKGPPPYTSIPPFPEITTESCNVTFRPSYYRPTSPRVFTEARHEPYNRSKLSQRTQAFKRYVENYRRHIFCVVIFYAIVLCITAERGYYYAVASEHYGIRQVTEVGIIVSRGTAAGVAFCYCFILLTMCRNIITALRVTPLNHYIPFDSAVGFHKIIAMTGLVLSLLHSIGHVVNVYHFSISPLSVLACLFPNEYRNNGSEIPSKFYVWFFQTIPGFTGVLILAVLAAIYIFSSQFSRSKSFNAFWWCHQLYVLLYILTILHGSGGLVQAPFFYKYLLPPALIFLGDRLISLSRRKVEITVVKVELLPSGVTHLQLKRPQGFKYKSGQWVRVACLALGQSEYHPITISSAPHENTLSIHVRAVGPWTTRLREIFSTKSSDNEYQSKIYLDGPFGEGHQHWNDFEVSVLVGGGIGVTPFASILKDIVHKSSINARLISCKKVYFIWVTRRQRQFEWLTDIIREVEENDKNDLVSVHIYITQFAEKFDLRTMMLYIFERHFQKMSNRSLFTGLRSITHFGRPQFVPFLNSLQNLHPQAETVGVFSCGPPGLTKMVDKSCRQLNRRDQAKFVHHFENF
ncbi:dual oxidase 1-like [Petromyzon marinus]|uniref:dual oxidase 1-like n=1 Tax=Petromyzon marinus TaxID=7757 RepID=UPI003F6EEA20